MALEAGYTAFKETWSDPERATGLSTHADYYDRLWAYYTNDAFSRYGDLATQWANLKKRKDLYQYHRSIYNPTFRAVKFYRDSIYIGALPYDGKDVDETVRVAIPFDKDISPALRVAIGQIWEWSGWLTNMGALVTNTAALGNVLVEPLDIYGKAKVVLKLWKPHFVKEIALDEAGNVKSFVIEHTVTERNRAGNKRSYVYRREVDGQGFRTYKDGALFDYTDGLFGAEYTHPYGFCPGVWFRHTVDELDSDYGLPVIHSVINKINELNDLVSQGHDQIYKIMASPVLIRSSNKPGSSSIGTKATTPSEEQTQSTRERIPFVYVGENGGAESIPLSIGDALEWVRSCISEIEQDLPELGFPRRLSEVSTLTGPAAVRVLRDVVDAHLGIQSGYDHKSKQVFQQAVAIAGFALNSGTWLSYAGFAAITAQQEKFRTFSLDSFKKGDLEFTILPRPLLSPTDLEKWQARAQQLQAVDIAVNKLNVPEEEGWEEAGYEEKKRKTWAADLEVEKAQQAKAMAALNVANTQAQQGADKEVAQVVGQER